MNFVAMTLELRAEKQFAPLGARHGVFAHAAVLKSISDQNPELGRRLHDIQRYKCMTLAIVGGNRRDATLRLTFMAQDGIAYAEALIHSLSARPVLRLGNARFAITAVNPNDPRWGGISTWADLCEGKRGRYMSFAFLTPTATMKRGEGSTRFTSLYPEPSDVFAGLRRRWQALSGPALVEDLDGFIRAGGCVVSQYNLRTLEFRTIERTQVGFVGGVTYECLRNEPECVAALNALSRFAFFSGVGYQTARGMGAVTTSISN